MSVKRCSPELKNTVAECLAQLWIIEFGKAALEKNNKDSEFWHVVENFAQNIPKYWNQFSGNKTAMLRRHHIFFYKDRPIGDLIKNQSENMNIVITLSSTNILVEERVIFYNVIFKFLYHKLNFALLYKVGK